MNGWKKSTAMRMLIVGFLASIILLAFSLSVYGATAGKRLAGDTRFQTARLIAEEFAAGMVDNVILTSGNNFPDALSASVLAQKLQAPILLVESKAADSTEAFTYIDAHLRKDGTVYIIGGTGLIGEDFLTELRDMGYYNFERLGGFDRYSTAVLVAQRLDVEEKTPVVIASGETFPDALSISSFAADKGWPILLAGKDFLPEGIKNYIAAIQPSQVYIVGGSGVVSSAVETQIQSLLPAFSLTRLAGKDRFETNALLMQAFAPDPENIYLTTGLNFADAVAGSVLAAQKGFPVMLIDPSSPIVPVPAMPYLTKLYETGSNPAVHCFGGDAVVPPSVVSNALDFLNGKITKDSIYKIDNLTATVSAKDKYYLPLTVKAFSYEGTSRDVAVIWDKTEADTTTEGTYTYYGTVEGYNEKVTLTLVVLPLIKDFQIPILEIYKGAAITLPKTVQATTESGKNVEVPVVWDSSKILNSNTAGTQTLSGTMAIYKYSVEYWEPKVKLYLHVRVPATSTEAPLKIIDKAYDPYGLGITTVFDSELGAPKLNMAVENISAKDIAGFEFSSQIYDCIDRPVIMAGGYSNTFNAIVQNANLNATGEGNIYHAYANFSFDLNLFKTAQNIKNLRLISVKFKDGTVWSAD
jgi:putative cell wall-binding protein